MQVPIVIRGPGGVGRQLGAEHSQRLESYFQSIPGVQLVAVSTVANAKALLKSAIRSDNPIIFFEHVLLYNVKGAPSLPTENKWLVHLSALHLAASNERQLASSRLSAQAKDSSSAQLGFTRSKQHLLQHTDTSFTQPACRKSCCSPACCSRSLCGPQGKQRTISPTE